MSDKLKIKRIPKADIEEKRAEQQIRRAAEHLRFHARKYPHRVREAITDLAIDTKAVLA